MANLAYTLLLFLENALQTFVARIFHGIPLLLEILITLALPKVVFLI
jgi:hypothetical protein